MPNPGKRIQAALARMMQGETLHAEITRDGVSYWLEPSGTSVGPATAGRLLGLACIKPGGDTLLDAVNQTYRYVEEARR